MNEELHRIVCRLEGDVEALKDRVQELEKSRLYTGDCLHIQNTCDERP